MNYEDIRYALSYIDFPVKVRLVGLFAIHDAYFTLMHAPDDRYDTRLAYSARGFVQARTPVVPFHERLE